MEESKRKREAEEIIWVDEVIFIEEDETVWENGEISFEIVIIIVL